jgi:hypothetical protein
VTILEIFFFHDAHIAIVHITIDSASRSRVVSQPPRKRARLTARTAFACPHATDRRTTTTFARVADRSRPPASLPRASSDHTGTAAAVAIGLGWSTADALGHDPGWMRQWQHSRRRRGRRTEESAGETPAGVKSFNAEV